MPVINGSQALALKRLGANFEHYRAIEFDKYAMASYNEVHGTKFEPTDIKDVKGIDLGIADKEHFTYLLTYSFPCTDLSIAGKQAGMARGSGTRSGLLWEVERLLTECNELGNLPDVLVMENVTEVHGYKNKSHFDEWISFLDGLGYTSYLDDLNAADYLVAQHRERAIMVSILGNYNFKFPVGVPIDTCMADYLEDEVDEKFYLKSKKAYDLIVKLVDNGTLPKDALTNERTNERTNENNYALTSRSKTHSQKISPTVFQHEQIEELVSDVQKVQGLSKMGFIERGTGEHQSNQVWNNTGICPTLTSVSHKDPIKIVEDK